MLIFRIMSSPFLLPQGLLAVTLVAAGAFQLGRVDGTQFLRRPWAMGAQAVAAVVALGLVIYHLMKWSRTTNIATAVTTTPPVTTVPIVPPTSTRPPVSPNVPVFPPSTRPTVDDEFKEWLKQNGDPFNVSIPPQMPTPPSSVIVSVSQPGSTLPTKPPVMTPTSPPVVIPLPPVVTPASPTPPVVKPTPQPSPAQVPQPSSPVVPTPVQPSVTPPVVPTKPIVVPPPPASVLTEVPSATGSNLTKEQAQVLLDEHNKRRDMLGKQAGISDHLPVPSPALAPLVWDEALARNAQAWSEVMLKDGKMYHSNAKLPDGTRVGENISWRRGWNASAALDPAKQVVGWFDAESPHYDYASKSCAANQVCGHMTQIAWRDTKKIGCGVARQGAEEYWACQFYPPGNWVGKNPY